MNLFTAERHLYPQSRCSGIYLIRNTVTRKSYVGSALEFAHRIQVHASRLRRGKHHTWELQKDFNAYGEAAFEVKILLICASKDRLFFEQRFLDRLPFVEKGYNISSDATAPMTGRKHTAVSRAKLSASKIGNTNAAGNKGSKHPPMTDEHRQHLSEAHKGYRWTEEAKIRLSAALSGRASVPHHSEESKAKMSAAHKVIQSQRIKQPMAGKHHSEETKAKMSAAHKGKPKSAETKARMKAAVVGRPPVTEETKAKIRLARAQQAPASEETRRKISEAGKGRGVSEKSRQALITRNKARTGQPGTPLTDEHKQKLIASNIARTGTKVDPDKAEALREKKRAGWARRKELGLKRGDGRAS